MASGQRSTDPSGAGDQTAPGLQTPRSWAAACVTSFCSEVRHQDAPPSLRVDAIQPTTTGWATAPAPTMGPTKEPPRPWAQRGDLPSREDGRRREGPVSREKPADSRLHIYSPTSLGASSCENEFWCPKVAGGEWFLYGAVRAFSKIPYKVGQFFSPPNPPKIVLCDFRRPANWPGPAGARGLPDPPARRLHPRPRANWPRPRRGRAARSPSTNWRAATAAAVWPSRRRRTQDRWPTGEVACPWERPPRPGPRERNPPPSARRCRTR